MMVKSIAGMAMLAPLLLLAGCGGGNDTARHNDGEAGAANIATTVEDTSPDSLVAPDNMTFGTGDDDANDMGANAMGADLD